MYRKFTASRVFDGYGFAPGGTAVITQQDGTIEILLPVADAGDDVREIDGIISPGFINCHCHLELSHLKHKIPTGTGLVDFALDIIHKREASTEIIGQAIEQAEDEMIKNGIVAVGDICNTTHTLTRKAGSRMHYQNFIELIGFNPVHASSVMAKGKEMLYQFNAKFSANFLVPHAPYSVSTRLLRMLNDEEDNDIISIHNQETEMENVFFLEKKGDINRLYDSLELDISYFHPTGKSSLQSFLPFLNKKKKIILVHNVATTVEDVQFAQAHENANNQEIFYCICINANQYISGITPDLQMLIKNDAMIVLGTDSFASNNSLSIWDEIKTLQKLFPGISLETLFAWATSNGARALGIEHNYGSFQKGKKPGIISIVNGRVERLL